MSNEIYSGSKFRICLKNGQKLEFILADSFDAGYTFQLVCINGYDAGKIFGQIKDQEKFKRQMMAAIDEQFLILEIERNVLDFDKSIPVEFIQG